MLLFEMIALHFSVQFLVHLKGLLFFKINTTKIIIYMYSIYSKAFKSKIKAMIPIK